MRAGPNWAAHQTLTAEAATVLRHSLGLARQRRHAQLTPLHVAVALLTTRPSILLKCCLASSQPPLSLPHTLQNRALELCFNVALNRLPTTPAVPFLSTHDVSLSNALVAAMKRAQASQRRGCGELQNSQQFMGVMVELEQLIISILDDPSVSRVMRDAGLSSIAVKGHIEDHFSSVSFHGGLASRFHEGRNVCHLMETITKPLNQVKGGDGLFNCCVDCTNNYEKEAELLKSRRQQKGVLPIWLQHQSEVAPTTKGDELAELRRKWSSLCQSLHRHCHYPPSKNTCSTPSSYPWWPTQKPIINPGVTFGAVKLNNGDGGGKNCNFMDEQLPNLDFLKNGGGKDERINLTLGNNYVSGLRRVLKENVPWQSEKIGPIVEALMNPRKSKKDTWLMIDGDDAIGKRRLVSAIAESLHRSIAYFNMKEDRAEAENLFDEILNRGSGDENILVLVENVDSANTRFIRRLSDRFDTKEKEDNGGKLVFVLTKGDSNCNEEANSVIQLQLKVKEAIDHQKRKLDFRFPINIKKPRIGEKEDPILGTIENAGPTKRKDHFFFDLNVEAEEYPDEPSPNSSDLTRDEQTDPFSFLESIRNQFTFNRSLTRDREMADFFSSKFKESFDLVFGDQNKSIEFSIDDALLPKISAVSGFVSNRLLGKWLEEIFQTSLNMVKISGKSIGGSVALCRGGESFDEGFLRSCLPKKIDIQFDK